VGKKKKKKTWGQVWQGENKWPGRARRKKKVSWEKNNKSPKKKGKGEKGKKKKKKLTKETDSFIQFMKSKNRIFWMVVHWWGAGSLEPLFPSNFNCCFC
jgi:hypothetical protein